MLDFAQEHALCLGAKMFIILHTFNCFLFLEIGMKNVALHKPANQTHTYVDPGVSKAWVAGRAVDDCLLRDPYTPPYCCSVTLADNNNYWHLNLQDEYHVQRIVIYGRTDSKLS